MTYDARESSAYSGNPVELYEFNRGSSYWRYTSGDEDIAWNAQTWERVPISRTALDETGELNRVNLEITLQRDNPVADLFRLYPPGDIVTVKIWRKHRDDAEAVVIWAGRVLNCEFKGGEAVLHTEPVYTSIRRNGLRRFYQRQCPHVLYGPSCGVNQTLYKASGPVIAISGNTIQVAAAGSFANGYFAGGYVSWLSGAWVTENRLITDHTGVTLTLSAPILGLAVGLSVDVYPGCDHTLSTCQTKFSNHANYGGWPYIPTKNPFNLQILY